MRYRSGICIGAIWLVFIAFSSFFAGGNAWCQSSLAINYSTQSMGFGAQQNLSASGGCPPYIWSLSGGGSLTPGGGDNSSATYTAPTSNPSCASNAIITLTDSCKGTACIKIAATNVNLWIALRSIKFVSCGGSGLIEGEWWYCDGTSTGPSCYTAAGSQGPCP
jgi:hypothetical protein